MKLISLHSLNSTKASFLNVSPLPGSSPIERSPTRGLSIPNRTREYTEPMIANCVNHSASTSAFAPASNNTVCVLPGTGIGVAIAGRLTPLMRPIRKSAEAIVAPVLPAEIIALAFPSRTNSADCTSVESFLVRTEDAGSSCMSMNSVATCSGKLPMSKRVPRSAGPTKRTGMPRAAACFAPSIISAGALSPPSASTATGSINLPEIN